MSNKLILKNTSFLYMRMLVTIVISLYTSRVVLLSLGITDFGIYNIVGGVVTMFGFLSASLSGASARFFSYEIGSGNSNKLKVVFASNLTAYLIITMIVLILTETVGLYLLNSKLKIPFERRGTVQIVYQLSIVATLIGILQTPYSALLIAREKMGIYAAVEIFNVLSKLIIVFLLPIIKLDKLLTYSILILIISIVSALIYTFACLRNFGESRTSIALDWKTIKPILAFSGWDLFGNMGARLYQQGTSMLLNTFFGVIVNAASGIATTVQNVLFSFSYNVTMAFKPPIIQQYAKKNYTEMFRLFNYGTRLSSFIILLLILPLINELAFVLKIWLNDVPPYTVQITRILLYISIINQLQINCNTIIHATGKVKALSLFCGCAFSFSILIVYILFKFTNFPLSAYYFFILLHIAILIFDLLLIKKLINIFSIRTFLTEIIGPVIILAITSFFISYILKTIMNESFIRLLVNSLITCITTVILIYLLLLKSDEKSILLAKIRQLS